MAPSTDRLRPAAAKKTAAKTTSGAKASAKKAPAKKAPAKKAPAKKASGKPASTPVAATRRWAGAAHGADAVNEAKRLAVIRAAGAAFKAKGFHNTSLDEVAATLNVTKPTLYYYIRNKQDLLYQCHDHALDLGEAAVVHANEGRSGLEKLQRLLVRYIGMITDDFSSYSLLSDLNDCTPEQKEAILERRRAFDRTCRDYVKTGIADGSVRPCDPMLAVAWFMGSVNAIPRWFATGGALTGDELAARYTAFITQGLAA